MAARYVAAVTNTKPISSSTARNARLQWYSLAFSDKRYNDFALVGPNKKVLCNIAREMLTTKIDSSGLQKIEIRRVLTKN